MKLLRQTALDPLVLFGQSYYLRFDPKLYRAMQPYAPMGSLYAAAYVRRKGYQVSFFDAMLARSEDEWAQKARAVKPRYAVLFEDNFNYLSKMCLLRMREAAFRMARAAKVSGAIVIACGSDATDHAPEYFRQGVNFVIAGEGEAALGELLESLEGRSQITPGEIKGLVFPGKDGEEFRTPPREPVKNLDEFPFPAWDLIDVERYRSLWVRRHGYFSMNMATTRGCPYRCNWCAKPIWGNRYNARSPESVADELAWLKKTFQPDHIWFCDDIFGLKPGWIEEFASRVEKTAARTPFKCLLRADLVTAPIATALARAACDSVWMGAESGSQPILDAMDKGQSVQDIERAAGLLRRHGIKTGFFIQFGYPGETKQDIRRTISMLRRLLPDELGISVAYPLPGTKFFDQVNNSLGTKKNWQDSDDLAMLYKGPFTTNFYRRLHQFVHRDLALRRGWRRLKDNGRSSSLRDTAALALRALRWVPSRASISLGQN